MIYQLVYISQSLYYTVFEGGWENLKNLDDHAVILSVCTLVTSEFKDNFDADTKKHKQDKVDHGGIKNDIYFNLTKQIIDQKNRMDPATTEHHPLENEVDFELLCWCISKIQNQFGMTTCMGEIVIIKYRYCHCKGRGIFIMYILVSVPFGIVTGRYSESLWRTF